MTDSTSHGDRADELRRRAEEAAAKGPARDPAATDAPVPGPGQPLVHELRVHQIELEMQNEELRRAQRELEVSRKRYFDLYDLAPVGYCTISGNGIILEANLTASRLLGAARGRLLNQFLSRFVFAEDLDVFYRYMKALPGTDAPGECELRIVRDDVPFWARLEAREAQDAGPAPTYWIVIVDVSDHKRAEKERARLDRQAQESAKVESMGRLAGGVAHDLSNLLTPILGYSEMLLELAGVDDARREAVEAVVQAGRRARALVNQLLAVGRRQALTFASLDLNLVGRQLEQRLAPSTRARVTVVWRPAASLPAVRGDAGQLEQVLGSLAANALEAMPRGGTLTMATAAVDVNAAFAMVLKDVMPGRYVTASVSDTGAGMSADAQAHLFEPFFGSETADPGAGLGLAASYGIVRQHGGAIRVESQPGRGTTVTVYLPAEGAAAGAAAPRTGEHADLQGLETILVVDDNEQVRLLARDILKRQGYDVLAAASGSQALAMLAGHDGPVHLLLTDVMMPGMNGRELSERVAALRPATKVLYMTGYGGDVVDVSGLGDAAHVVAKPFSVRGLTATVRAVLDQA